MICVSRRGSGAALPGRLDVTCAPYNFGVAESEERDVPISRELGAILRKQPPMDWITMADFEKGRLTCLAVGPEPVDGVLRMCEPASEVGRFTAWMDHRELITLVEASFLNEADRLGLPRWFNGDTLVWALGLTLDGQVGPRITHSATAASIVADGLRLPARARRDGLRG